jgi:BTB/POZ domain-containing protein KCTD9
LLYRGTRDGFGAQDFHSKCDNKSPTLSICKAHESSFIFGGFASVSLNGSETWKSDPNAFLFSLTNKDNQPLKMKINPNAHQYAIQCNLSYGPIFGRCDIAIFNNANKSMESWSNLGVSYKHPQYAQGTNEAETFLAGSYKFRLNEIEVYQKTE